MLPGGTGAAQKGCSSARPHSPPTALRSTLPLYKLAKEHGGKCRSASFLTTLAACLCAVFAASIVLEAFDGDPALWPCGSENFTVASHGQHLATSQAGGDPSALNPILCFVVAAGARLVWGHRARSVLATDQSCIPICVNVAEPWGCT
jgi:hypothetical protein